MTLAAFLTVVAIHLLAAMSPGPSFVVSVRTAATEGFRAAIAVSVGFGIGAVTWALAALAGLAVLFEIAPTALIVLKVAGAVFLVWLAISMWRHAGEPLPVATVGAAPRSVGRAFLLGLTTQLSNPKPAVFFGAVFVGLVPPDTPLLWMAALLAVIGVNETLWYVLVGRLFSIGHVRDAYGRIKGTLDRVFGGVIAALAAKMAIG